MSPDPPQLLTFLFSWSPRFCRADLGRIFDFGLANFRKIAGNFLPANFSCEISNLASPGFQAPSPPTPKTVGILLQFQILELKIVSHWFSAYSGDQTLQYLGTGHRLWTGKTCFSQGSEMPSKSVSEASKLVSTKALLLKHYYHHQG